MPPKAKKKTVADEYRCPAKNLLEALNPPRSVIEEAERMRDSAAAESVEIPQEMVTDLERTLDRRLRETERLYPQQVIAVMRYFNTKISRRSFSDLEIVNGERVPGLRGRVAAKHALTELCLLARLVTQIGIMSERVQNECELVKFLIADNRK